MKYSGFVWGCLVCVLMLGACDSGGSSENVLPEKTLTPQREVILTNGVVRVELERDGDIIRSNWSIERDGVIDRVGGPLFSGLWMAAETAPSPRALMGGLNFENVNGYGFALPDSSDAGIFTLEHSTIQFDIANFPIRIGPPSNLELEPEHFGDHMAWSVYESDAQGDNYDTSLENILLEIGITLFERDDFEDMIVVDYTAHNVGTDRIPGLHVGYMSDTDLTMFRNNDRLCGLFPGDNQSAYNRDRNLVFTYNSSDSADSNIDPECYGTVVGFTPLPIGDSSAPEVFSNRILTEHASVPYFASFARPLIDSPEKVLLALKGLDENGNPMINPETGMSTKYAFTGDPVTGTGWIDEPNDLRQLMSFSPVDLEPGESIHYRLAWIFALGSDLPSAIEELFRKTDLIKTADLSTAGHDLSSTR